MKAAPMKIAYLGQMADVSTENGISKKIRSQAAHWLEAGHAVRYFSLVPTTAYWSGMAPLEADLVARGRWGQRAFRSRELARRIRAWRPDVIYFRYAYHSPGLPALFREIPAIAEINSDDLTEYPVSLSRTKLAYHWLTRNRILKTVTAFVPVTRELAQRFSGFGRPAEAIGNGIDLAGFTTLRPPDSSSLRLAFAGSAGTPWHGLDRVGELARLFPDVVCDIVGCTREDWRAATSSSEEPPANLVFHGNLPRSRYEPLMQQATAALGTLGLYRKKMDEACPLKVREYLAFGLPVLAGYEDTDVPAGADYFFQLPNNQATLAPHREKIAAWLERWRGRRVPRTAIAHLDTAEKEKQRLAFITQIATASRP